MALRRDAECYAESNRLSIGTRCLSGNPDKTMTATVTILSVFWVKNLVDGQNSDHPACLGSSLQSSSGPRLLLSECEQWIVLEPPGSFL